MSNTTTHLLDTSVFSQPIRRRPVVAALDRWDALGDARLAVSVISEAEVRYGVEWENRPELRQAFAASLKDRLHLLLVDSAVAQAYAVIRADLRRRGRPVGDMDILIAATAKVHGLIVATLNAKHFEAIADITVEDWSTT